MPYTDETTRKPTREDIDAAAARPGSSRRPVTVAAIVVVGLLVVGAVTGIVLKQHLLSPSGAAHLTASAKPPASASNHLLTASDANLMGLQKLGGSTPASFSLEDQHGRTVALSSLEKRPVVLTFFDSMCTDICPLEAQEMVDAVHDLGPRAKDVTFVAVNVNAAHSSVADVNRFIDEHGLRAVPHFVYFTGTAAQLRPVWHEFGEVVKVAKGGAVVHNSLMDFLAPGGSMRYQATPFANERANGTGWLPPATISQWGQGIARYSGQLIPR